MVGRYRTLSTLVGVRISPIQLGAMSIGDKWDSIGMGSMDKEAELVTGGGADVGTGAWACALQGCGAEGAGGAVWCLVRVGGHRGACPMLRLG